MNLFDIIIDTSEENKKQGKIDFQLTPSREFSAKIFDIIDEAIEQVSPLIYNEDTIAYLTRDISERVATLLRIERAITITIL
jgi:hypothetical protein